MDRLLTKGLSSRKTNNLLSRVLLVLNDIFINCQLDTYNNQDQGPSHVELLLYTDNFKTYSAFYSSHDSEHKIIFCHFQIVRTLKLISISVNRLNGVIVCTRPEIHQGLDKNISEMESL